MAVILYNTSLNKPLAQFNGEIVWHNEHFKKEMIEHGITIPHFYQSIFEGREVIFPGDPLFKKAIKEIYCKIMHNHMELKEVH